VPISEEELESLEAETNRSIDLKEFIPLASVDPVYFENTHYLGAGKGGEKSYRLFADAMAKSGRVAIAELVSRGKEQLVLIPLIATASCCTRCTTRTRDTAAFVIFFI
jgi:DNA end-binding protein Ku